MRFEDEWAANEDCLVQEAGSLGALLGRMRGLFSRPLVDDPEWEKLTACAQDLPPTLAGFPLWIGFPIDDSRPAVYLDVSLLGSTQSAATVREKGRSIEADPLTAVVDALLGQTAREESPVRQVAGDRVLLHYAMDAARRVPLQAHALLYPIRSTLAGEGPGQCLQNFRAVLDALAVATGRALDGAEYEPLERVYLAMEPGTRIGAIGVSPSQGSGLRLAVLGLSGTEHTLAFLDRAGWCGDRSAAARILARLEAKGALVGMHLGVQLDVTAAGVGQALEVQIFSANTIYDDTGWFKDKGCWSHLIDGLREEGLASAEKLSELDKWSFGAKPLFGRSGPLLLLQRIHHLSLLLDTRISHRINAHVFVLLTRWAQDTGNPG